MANSDKNIVITPNISNTAEPKIVFTGGNNNPTTLRVLDDGTLSFEGGAGQLFSIANNLTGQIFAVNDISGIPSIEAYSNGLVTMARYNGKVSIGANVIPGSAALSIQSNTTVTGIDISGSPQTAGAIRFSTGPKISPVATKELVFTDTNQIRLTDGITWLYDDWGGFAYSTGNSSFWIGKGGTGSGPISGNSNTVANVNFVGISAFTIANSSTNKLTLAANGNLGLGNTTPGVKLAITSTDAVLVPIGNTAQRPTAAAGLFRFNSDTNSFEGSNTSAWGAIAGGGGGGATLIANTTDTQTFYLPMANTTSGTWSNAVVTNTKLYFVPSTGTLNATVFNSLSDEAKKTNIQLIQNALDIVEGLDGVTFDFIDGNVPSAGLLAGQVEARMPQLVTVNENGDKTLNYNGVIGVLVEAVKTLSIKIKELEKSR